MLVRTPTMRSVVFVLAVATVLPALAQERRVETDGSGPIRQSRPASRQVQLPSSNSDPAGYISLYEPTDFCTSGYAAFTSRACEQTRLVPPDIRID